MANHLNIMVMPERYSVAGLVRAYRLMKSKLNDPDFRWVNKESQWMGYVFLPSDWFDWFARCVEDKINSRLPYKWGKGKKARRRHDKLRDAAATCKWCGSPTGKVSKQFCDSSCAISYRN